MRWSSELDRVSRGDVQLLDVGAAGTEERDPSFCAPLDVLTQVELISLERQPAVPSEEPDEREPPAR